MDVSEKITVCIEIEKKAAEVYNNLSKIFPEANELFKEIAAEEENHAIILQLALAYYKAGKLPEDTFASLTPSIKETFVLITGFGEKVKSKDITLSEALEQAIFLEQSIAEQYLLDFISIKNSDIVDRLKKLLFDTDTHADKLKNFISAGNWT